VSWVIVEMRHHHLGIFGCDVFCRWGCFHRFLAVASGASSLYGTNCHFDCGYGVSSQFLVDFNLFLLARRTSARFPNIIHPVSHGYIQHLVAFVPDAFFFWVPKGIHRAKLCHWFEQLWHLCCGYLSKPCLKGLFYVR